MIIRVSMTGEKKEAGKKEKKGVAGYDGGTMMRSGMKLG